MQPKHRLRIEIYKPLKETSSHMLHLLDEPHRGSIVGVCAYSFSCEVTNLALHSLIVLQFCVIKRKTVLLLLWRLSYLSQQVDGVHTFRQTCVYYYYFNFSLNPLNLLYLLLNFNQINSLKYELAANGICCCSTFYFFIKLKFRC